MKSSISYIEHCILQNKKEIIILKRTQWIEHLTVASPSPIEQNLDICIIFCVLSDPFVIRKSCKQLQFMCFNNNNMKMSIFPFFYVRAISLVSYPPTHKTHKLETVSTDNWTILCLCCWKNITCNKSGDVGCEKMLD